MNKRIFTAQLGSGNTIKVFDAETGNYKELYLQAVMLYLHQL